MNLLYMQYTRVLSSTTTILYTCTCSSQCIATLNAVPMHVHNQSLTCITGTGFIIQDMHRLSKISLPSFIGSFEANNINIIIIIHGIINNYNRAIRHDKITTRVIYQRILAIMYNYYIG